VNDKAGLTFAVALKAFLRQDPDIIMVGEIRDLETGEIAIKAAQTGHMVLSTLHTNDAPSAIMRLMELGVAPYLINATVLGVLGQRLARTLCPLCKTPDTGANRADLDEVIKPWQANGTYNPYKAVGCVDCRMTGFKGRMGLYELMVTTEAFKDKVTRDPSMDALRRQAVADGMRPLRLIGAMRVSEGLTTLDEVLACTPPLLGA
jgi:general secretion pathway protein E